MANSLGPDQTAPVGAVCSGSTLFAFIIDSSEMLGNYLQQTTSADNIFRCIFFLGALRVNTNTLITLSLPVSSANNLPVQKVYTQSRLQKVSDQIWIQTV